MNKQSERFWSRVDIQSGNKCWLWKGFLDRDGYGLFTFKHGQTVRSHRYSYALTKDLEKGKPLDHLCRTRACVRPSHLELVTPKINAERSITAQKTHCKHGHLFDEANTYIRPNGCRTCRSCHAATQRKRKVRNAEIYKAWALKQKQKRVA